jgi:hypothetical protein
MLEVCILTSQLVLVPGNVFVKFALLRIDYVGERFLATSCLKEHQNILHPYGFFMLLLKPGSLLIGVLERVLSRRNNPR